MGQQFKLIRPLLLLLFLGVTRLAYGQENTTPINLETVLTLGGANNLTIKEYKLKQDLALADFAKAKEWWLPNLYAGTSFHQLWGNAMNSDGRIFTDVNRQSFWGGVGVNSSWDFGNGIFTANAAELSSEATALETEAQQNQTLLSIIETYYDFLVAQLYAESYAQLAAQAKTIADQIEIQVDAGLLFESELLLAQSSYSHLQVQMMSAQLQQNTKSALLTQLLNIDPTSRLVCIDTVLTPLTFEKENLELETSFEPAYQKRPELKSMDLMLQALNAEKKTTTTGLLLPSFSVGAYGSYFGGVFTPVNPTSSINASLIWTIPTGRLIYGGKLKQFDARIALQENQILQAKAAINREVLYAKGRIILAKEQLDIALEGSRLAEKALDQCVQRQQLGTVRPFEILQAQEIYINSRLDYLTSVSSYNKAQYQLLVATGNNL
ncbi:MAG: TolC family protein [Flavobacteriales bacterium]|nr:TolC family protein [Flavobacteriales bacterium]